MGYFNGTTMSQVHASGNVTATGNYVGGLAGQAIENVSFDNAWASGNVSGSYYTGGLAGYIWSPVATTLTASGTVFSSTNDAGGLVGYLTVNAFSDAHATGAVTGQRYVGGLVGYASNFDSATDLIANVDATGAVTGWRSVGGLVGQSRVAIDSSWATGNVVATSWDVGGLVGNAGSTVSNSHATGNVTAAGGWGGGLVGEANKLVSNSYATGAVSGASYMGGLVGAAYDNTTNSYATGAVHGSNYVGGLLGSNYGVVTGATASGNVTATGNRVGGLVGQNFGYGRASIVSSSASGNVSGNDYVGGLVGASYNGHYEDTNFDAGLDIHTLQNVSSSGTVTGHSYVGGVAGYNNAFVDGIADVVSTTSTVTGTGNAVGGIVGQNDHDGSISNFTTTRTVTATGGGTGIGGVVGENEGVVLNVHAANTVNSDGTDVGGIVGLNVGTGTAGEGNGGSMYIDGGVVYSYATNTVNGATSVGGLVGANVNGLVGIVYSAGTVNGTTQVGGLIGSQTSSLQGEIGTLYAYSTSTVNGTDQVGGLIGSATGGVIIDTYASGAVHGTGPAVGGFVGVGGAMSQDNFYDAQITGQAHSVGDTSNGEVAGGMTTAQMHQASTFASWGVDTTGTQGGLWRSYDGSAAPLLTYWLTPLAVTVNTGTTTHVYDGTIHGNTFGDVEYTDTLAPGHVLGAPFYYTAVNVGTYTDLGGLYSDQQGYNMVITNTGSLTITPAMLSAMITGVSKTYDGTTSATLGSGNYVLTGFVQGEGASVTQTAGTYNSKNVVGASSVTATLGSGDYAANEGTLMSNYTLPTTATGAATITPKSVSASATGVDKTYDGTIAATANVGLSGIVDGDIVGSTSSAAFLDKNAGTAKQVNVSAIALTGGDASNYALGNTTTTTAASITPKVITVNATGADKVYDGSVSDAATLASSGIVSGDTVSFTGTGTFADKNAGAAKVVTVGGITASGTDAGNYQLESTTATSTATITPRTVVVSASSGDKVYDGSTAASTTLAGSNLVAGDDISFNSTASFADKNAGAGKTVTSTVAASGEDAGNYVFNTTATSSATITPKTLTLAATGNDKVYDGSTLDAVTLQAIGVVEGDTASFAGTGNFADKNAGAAKVVNVTGIAGSGQDAGNYVLASTTATTTATISPRSVVVSASGGDKVYDGATTTSTTLAGSNLVAGDDISFNSTASFADKNAGAGKTVTSTVAASGEDAGNYVFNTTATSAATITPRTVVVSASGGDKVYDGSATTSTTLAGSNLVAGDDISFNGTASYADKNAGAGKTVTSTVAASGGDAGNYVFNTTATSSATITPKTLTLAATGSDKVYDGSTLDAVTLQASGVVEGDTASFAGTGNFADKNAGAAKLVNVSGITATGIDAGNYTFSGTGTATAAITPRTITVSLTGSVIKVTDGTTAATLNAGNYAVGNVVDGESVIVTKTSGTYDNAGDGQNKTVTVTLTGADYLAGGATLLSNYTLVSDTLAGKVGLIEPSVKLESAFVSMPNLPSGIDLGTILRVDGMQQGADEGDHRSVQDESRSISVVGSNTKENLLKRRAFSIGDGGIRLPAGVRGSDKDASQP